MFQTETKAETPRSCWKQRKQTKQREEQLHRGQLEEQGRVFWAVSCHGQEEEFLLMNELAEGGVQDRARY